MGLGASQGYRVPRVCGRNANPGPSHSKIHINTYTEIFTSTFPPKHKITAFIYICILINIIRIYAVITVFIIYINSFYVNTCTSIASILIAYVSCMDFSRVPSFAEE